MVIYMYLTAAQPNETLSAPMLIFFSGYEQTPPNHACGPGIWPHYLMHFVLSGTGSFTSSNKTYMLSAGDAFLIIPGLVSSYKSSLSTPWEYCWIGFDGPDAKAVLNSCHLTESNPVFHCEEFFLSIKETFFAINEALQSNPYNNYLHLSLLYKLFSLLVTEKNISPQEHGLYLVQAIKYIQNNYIYGIRVLDIANHIGIDRTYLYKIFLKELGISPQQYLVSYRLSKAKHLLSSTSLQITEISNSCGFSDTSSLCHHFQKKFHISPSQYRAESGTSPI